MELTWYGTAGLLLREGERALACQGRSDLTAWALELVRRLSPRPGERLTWKTSKEDRL